MNRADLQQLTEMRLGDAQALLATGNNDSGAYYMAGYAIECALKAVISKNQGEYPFPPYIKENDLRQKYYTHDLTVLLTTAQLDGPFGAARSANTILDTNWSIVVLWDETVRYQAQTSRQKAEELVQAIGDQTNGVLQWLKNYW